MKRKLVLTLLLALALPPSVLAWNATGHQAVAHVAWDNLTPTAKQNVIALLQAAPPDACLLDLFSDDASRPLEERQREFFMLASTWPDIVRPGENDTRACIRFHRANWHFINFFWEGISGSTNNPPKDRNDIEIPEVNIVERLKFFRPFVACGAPTCATAACGIAQEERATTLAWILHLVGDIHQPLHTSARVTTLQAERQGDRGGGLFKLGTSQKSPSLHTFWDGIVDKSIRRQSNESDLAYLDRVAATIETDHPRSQFSTRLRPGDFDAWAREGLATTKAVAYPKSLKRNQTPSETYRKETFTVAEEAIALGGYRLADLLNQMFDSAQP